MQLAAVGTEKVEKRKQERTKTEEANQRARETRPRFRQPMKRLG